MREEAGGQLDSTAKCPLSERGSRTVVREEAGGQCSKMKDVGGIVKYLEKVCSVLVIFFTFLIVLVSKRRCFPFTVMWSKHWLY